MKRRKAPSAQPDTETLLSKVDAQSEKTFSPTPETDTSESDWTERWGKRLGLTIGYGLALYMLWHLLSTYVLT
jgi:hypothetical protein